MFDAKKLRVSLLILGVVAIVVAIALFCVDVGSYESNEYYGGDAYTGIQQAAAQAANNVLAVGKMIRLGIGGLLIVQGLVFLAASVCIKTENKTTVSVESVLNENLPLEGTREASEEKSCIPEQKECV